MSGNGWGPGFGTSSGKLVALNAKTGEYVWHFQQVHHDIWDYDAASPVVLFDTVIDGQPRKAIAEGGRTGWVYILDRTNGNQSRAAEVLGIHRNTLSRKITEYKLDHRRSRSR